MQVCLHPALAFVPVSCPHPPLYMKLSHDCVGPYASFLSATYVWAAVGLTTDQDKNRENMNFGTRWAWV